MKFSERGKIIAHILTYDFNSKQKNAIVGDLTKKETIPSDKIDCFICTQTLNFIYDVKSAIKNAHSLLKPGGTMLATVACLTQISRYDMDRWGDYWRFTDLSIGKLFEEVFGACNVDIYIYGNVLAAISLLQGAAYEDIPNKASLDEVDRDYPVIIGVVAKKQ